MNRDRKKMIVYAAILFFCFYLADKSAEGLRLYLECRDYYGLSSLGDGMALAFRNLLPSFYVTDIIAGCCAALLVLLLILQKKEEAKKFRKGIEYGSARWGKPADIEPYIDKDFSTTCFLQKRKGSR